MRRAAILIAALLVLVGCAPNGTGADVKPPLTSFITATTSGGTAHDFGVCAGVGDSITFGYVPYTTGPIGNAYMNGAGFLYASTGYTIQTGYTYYVTHGGTTPNTIVLMGGVNDIMHSESVPAVKAAIVTFTNERIAAGQHVIHLTEPYWTYDVSGINQWLIDTFPDTIDVATAVIPDGTGDGIHPNSTGMAHIAAIVDTHLNLYL